MSLKTFYRTPDEMDSNSFGIEKSGKSSFDVPDVPPGLSAPNSRWCDEDEDESPLATPEGTASGKPTAMEKVDWKTGSMAQLLMARHHLEEQFGFA